MIEQAYMQEDWFALLREKVAQSSVSQVARDLAYSTTAISLILNGKYNGKPDKLRDKIWQRYAVVSCPFSGSVIPVYQCQETSAAKAPTHNPLKMAQWKACQNCPKRCDKQAA